MNEVVVRRTLCLALAGLMATSCVAVGGVANALLALNVLQFGAAFRPHGAPVAPTEQDAAAKAFSVSAGKANIYLYRNETFRGNSGFEVSLDGRPLGTIFPMTFFRIEVEPGRHSLLSKDPGSRSYDSMLDVVADAGKNYFVWQEMKMEFPSGKTQLLQHIDETKGRAEVAECQLLIASP